MSERITELLAAEVDRAARRADEIRIEIVGLEEKLDDARADLAKEEAALRQLATHTALARGGLPLPRMEDIRETDGLGVGIGPYAWRVAPTVPPEHYRLYALAMDRLCSVAAAQSGKAMELLEKAEADPLGPHDVRAVPVAEALAAARPVDATRPDPFDIGPDPDEVDDGDDGLCGDCMDGKCHGDGPCGCDRHDASVAAEIDAAEAEAEAERATS